MEYKNLESKLTWSITFSSNKTWELNTLIDAPKLNEETAISGSMKTCL